LSLEVPFSIRAAELFIAPHQIEVASTPIEQFMQFDIQRCMIVPALWCGYFDTFRPAIAVLIRR
jgi:hypothetical protein